MKTRLVQSSFFFLFMIAISASLTFGQSSASVTWNLIGADSLSPTTTVGNVTGQAVKPADSIAIIDQKSIPNSPITGVTNAIRWAPYFNGAKVSWGNETKQNDNRWIQFALAPNAGAAFSADSISIYLGASGTTNHIRANLYYSTDPTFTTKTLLNPADTGVVPYRDSVQHYGYHVSAMVNTGDTLYFRVYPWYDSSPSTSKYLFTQYAQIFGTTSASVVPIKTARGMVNDTVKVAGVVISPNYQTTGRSYYIWDGTGGIATYKSGLTSPNLKLGDSVVVTGKVTLFNGLIEINLLADTSLVKLDSNVVLPQPEAISLAMYLADPESYESHLIKVVNLSLASGTWPTSGSKSIYLTDGKDTANVFLDSDMKLFNSPEPKWPVDLIGIGSQYTTTGTGGYEVLPRFISDFIPSVPIVSIDSARKAANTDTIRVAGVTISPNFQTSNRSYYIWDGTNGIVTFISGLKSPALKLGDSLVVTGKTSLFHGLLELNPLADSSIIVLDTGAVLPNPEVVTIPQYLADPENYESHLIEIKNVTLSSGKWPTSGSASLYFKNGADSVNVYLDSDMGLFNDPEPTWPVDLIGIASQYGTDTTGYQILPRFISDFKEIPIVPVELTSFEVQSVENGVELTWKTATEVNNSGFEVQRSADGKNFAKIAFVGGHGSTVKPNAYSFTDKVQNAGTYYYRLKQIDFNGSFKYSNVIQISAMIPKSYNLSQNYPNPFNPTTIISYNLPKTGNVVLKVYDILGNEVATLINREQPAGTYKITFNALNADHKNLSSGIYFYKLQSGNYSAIKKMLLLK